MQNPASRSFIVHLSSLRFLVVLPEQEVQGKIRNNTSEAQTADDAEAHEVLGLIVKWEQIRAVDLSKVTHGVDKGERDGPDLVGHGRESDGRVGQRETVGRPETGGHDDEERISGCEVVDGADNNGADHGNGHPRAEHDTAPLGVAVGEETRDSGADEGDAEDGDGHILSSGLLVAETVDKGRVEVGES